MKTSLYRSAVRGVFCFLLLLFALLFTQLPVTAAQSQQCTVGAASLSSPNVASIDAFVSSEIQEQRIPGLSLGIVQGTHIVHLHGFGTAATGSCMERGSRHDTRASPRRPRTSNAPSAIPSSTIINASYVYW